MATNALNAFNIDKNSGVNLNIYLGGFAKSWSDNLTSEPVTDVYGEVLEARTKLLTNTALCIPSVNSSTNQRVDFFNYTNGFHLGNALTGKYRALDPGLGLTNDKVLLPVGLNTFEDVFSLPNNPTIKAGLFGRPVHYEMWFSGNYHVLTNSVGYNNYTYFGSNNSGPYGNMNDTLPTVKLDVSGKIRSYIAGIFKVGANLPNLSASVDTTNISDIVAGVRYSESNSMGYLQIIINGVIQSSYQTEQIYEIFGYLDTKLKGEVGSLSEATGNVNYIGVWVTSGPNSSTPFETNGIDFYTTDEINSGTSSTDLRGLIDTYLVKQGFYIDADTGLNPGTVYQNDVIRYKPIPMYALPAVPLDPSPCEVYPNYVPIPIPPSPLKNNTISISIPFIHNIPLLSNTGDPLGTYFPYYVTILNLEDINIESTERSFYIQITITSPDIDTINSNKPFSSINSINLIEAFSSYYTVNEITLQSDKSITVQTFNMSMNNDYYLNNGYPDFSATVLDSDDVVARPIKTLVKSLQFSIDTGSVDQLYIPLAYGTYAYNDAPLNIDVVCQATIRLVDKITNEIITSNIVEWSMPFQGI